MKQLMVFVGLVFACSLMVSYSQAADRTPVIFGTATPGGGFELYGNTLAEIINTTDVSLNVMARGTRGSRQNIPLLEQGTLDIALVASLPAREAFEGINRPRSSSLKIVTAIYPTFGAFAVKGDSTARIFNDLIGQKVAWGTKSSGLTLLGHYVTDALGLNRDKDFDAVYLERAGQGPVLVRKGEVAAQWGGGVGWPNFTKIMQDGGRLIGMNDDQTQKINAKYPFLQPLIIPAESYPGQSEPLKTVGSFSFLLARADLPEELVYRLAKAIHKGQPELAKRLVQGRDTLPENTWRAASDPNYIHPGARRFLAELGFEKNGNEKPEQASSKKK